MRGLNVAFSRPDVYGCLSWCAGARATWGAAGSRLVLGRCVRDWLETPAPSPPCWIWGSFSAVLDSRDSDHSMLEAQRAAPTGPHPLVTHHSTHRVEEVWCVVLVLSLSRFCDTHLPHPQPLALTFFVGIRKALDIPLLS